MLGMKFHLVPRYGNRKSGTTIYFGHGQILAQEVAHARVDNECTFRHRACATMKMFHDHKEANVLCFYVISIARKGAFDEANDPYELCKLVGGLQLLLEIIHAIVGLVESTAGRALPFRELEAEGVICLHQNKR